MSTLIRNATIYDGSGAPPCVGLDVSIFEERIINVGRNLLPSEHKVIVDADGLGLMPGIIDSHTHYDAQVTWDRSLDPSPAHGVTTVIMGNCGFGIAPCRPSDRDLTMRNLTQVEGMDLNALRAGINWDFENFPEYLDFIEERGVLPNLAAFIGHSPLRTYVMGKAAVERNATDAERSEMCRILENSMQAGAIGFATSTAPQHNGAGGVPMPSRLADDKELEDLIMAMGKSGKGVFMLTKGDHTTIPFLDDLAGRSGRPFVVAALLHNPTDPDATFSDLRSIADARKAGRELWGQVSCCPLTMDFTMRSAYPFESLQSWKPAMQGGGNSLKEVFSNGAFRNAVRAELAHTGGVRLFNGEWDKLAITQVVKKDNQCFEHNSIAKLAAEAGTDPLDWLLDFVISEDLETVLTAILLNSDEEAVARIITDPNASVALSDAGAHLTFFCDAGFGLHLMGHWARRKGVMSLERAVYELTGKPADIYGIQKRGRIAPGYFADMVLFAPESVDRGIKRRCSDLPAGASRLVTDAVGVSGVWVNGSRVVNAEGEVDIKARTGKVLRKFDG